MTRLNTTVGRADRPSMRMGTPRAGAFEAAERIVAAGGCPATIGVVWKGPGATCLARSANTD
jgi:hypothetical protein